MISKKQKNWISLTEYVLKTPGNKYPSLIISGGGTGGHIYPALAIADAFKARFPDAVIHFVGAIGRMEMEKIPQHGYTIDGLPISGIQRKNLLKNLFLPYKIWASLQKVKQIIKKWEPQAAVGVGGYASGPMLFMAAAKGIPTLIQEQNSYPGITNKLLAKRVRTICVAYPGMDKFFPAEKIVLTGNPVRNFPVFSQQLKEKAASFFGLRVDKLTILVIGGSLGARTINQSVLNGLSRILEKNIQLIWQTGKTHYESISRQVNISDMEGVRIMPFIDRMEYAFAMADLVVSRAGAISISELALVKKPVILVPSPNVAEDHQTKNARVLSDSGAAILLADAEANEKLVTEMTRLLENPALRIGLAENIAKFARPNAAEDIVDEIVKLIKAEK